MKLTEKEFVKENAGKMPLDTMGNILVLASLTQKSPKTILDEINRITSGIQKFIFDHREEL